MRPSLPVPPRQLILDSITAHKIACDKTLPSCRNCKEKGQTCLGYGLKLSWPRASLHDPCSVGGA
ncbi:hypothetical protein QBC33DRAFT_552923 [Phialemonium atrogriseum]|uniref:Zn(2)-C6 fungal-type domain-containing protein n=1 Tax=Phialemonium atrogriseum TaxID=1093897 RepID=A0AAJ0BRY0_9PEZI|nr:uncharacterized protein QBC33DRAFT_552923 [Phialemonium atrogriseum]KAK1762019.1 hypothetical protein QBC33DRAFT_552923 [Phialemonium atrogriseum]